MNRNLMFLLFLLSILGVPLPARAHGAKITYQTTQAIAIQATYDSGEPMQQAQVVVYAPDSPTQPWTQGTTNAAGEFIFTPDPAKPGNWEVKVRQAGHGDIATIPVGEPPGTAATNQGLFPASATETLNPVQKWLLAGAVIWGFMGTALFFARGKRSRAHS